MIYFSKSRSGPIYWKKIWELVTSPHHPHIIALAPRIYFAKLFIGHKLSQRYSETLNIIQYHNSLRYLPSSQGNGHAFASSSYKICIIREIHCGMIWIIAVLFSVHYLLSKIDRYHVSFVEYELVFSIRYVVLFSSIYFMMHLHKYIPNIQFREENYCLSCRQSFHLDFVLSLYIFVMW